MDESITLQLNDRANLKSLVLLKENFITLGEPIIFLAYEI